SAVASGIEVSLGATPTATGALPYHLVQQRGSGRRRVKARDVAFYGQMHARIAPFLDETVHTLTLAADHQADALREVEIPGRHLPAWVERNAPHAGPFDLGDRRRHARDLRDPQQLARAGAGLDRGRREGCAPMLGQDGAVAAG